ncbi:GRF1-interacting factor 3-like isoform X2 [Phragmites australis]|uniref:GRF1-interacting factor 3-like isoform X2 n=1 Tax=Phragmites australis TaxID=29695 RepID=UPI002D796374|nr:GRF1-interacting factor 3-like isoform X2 [Phragmites australis]
MQQPMPMQPQPAAVTPAAGITTEQIQKYLDENKQLILAILEKQNLGKLAECAQYQAQLQKNLLYLAAIADAQPQTAMVPPGASPGLGQYMSQVPMYPPRTPLTPQQMQEQQLQQQQAQLLNFTGQMVVRPGMVNGMPQPLQIQQTHAANPQTSAAVSKQDVGGATSEPSGTESHRSTGADNDGGSD